VSWRLTQASQRSGLQMLLTKKPNRGCWATNTLGARCSLQFCVSSAASTPAFLIGWLELRKCVAHPGRIVATASLAGGVTASSVIAVCTGAIVATLVSENDALRPFPIGTDPQEGFVGAHVRRLGRRTSQQHLR